MARHRRLWAGLAFSWAACLAAAQSIDSRFEQVDVFISGTEGYHTFRIPAIVRTNNGDLLAFAEGRRGGRGDSGDIDLVMRRSDDGGKTWGEMEVVWDDGPNTCGNPCPVLDRDTGVIHLLVTHNLGQDHEREIIDQVSEGTRTVWVLTSGDAGESWSEPREITESAKLPNWTWYATGPGNGIQMRWGDLAGRMVVPCDHIEAESKKYFSHVIYSDDHGATWEFGGSTPTDQLNECAVAEVAPGKLLLNMRNYDRSKRARAMSFSADGGMVWGEVWRDEQLPEPICQASMIAMGDGGRAAEVSEFATPTLVFSNPASADGRVRMTVRTSGDGGRTWSEGELLHDGPSAYSSLVDLGRGSAGCLYERGERHPYERISFAVVLIWSAGNE